MFQVKYSQGSFANFRPLSLLLNCEWPSSAYPWAHLDTYVLGHIRRHLILYAKFEASTRVTLVCRKELFRTKEPDLYSNQKICFRRADSFLSVFILLINGIVKINWKALHHIIILMFAIWLPSSLSQLVILLLAVETRKRWVYHWLWVSTRRRMISIMQI